ncbi:MAG: hypothetical protein QNJ90_02965 [Planctomycetota bacterium]|nr:hypothetical protein [Planctomycetota bacterium]
MPRTSVFPVLYALAARAPKLAAEQFQPRLMTGLANHYGALWCALHTDATGWASATADPAPAVAALSRLDRARLETIEARLVKDTVDQQRMRSALDLDGRGDVDEFLSSRLGVFDIFAFPLHRGETPFAVMVLYLGEDSQHLGEEDIQALSSLGYLFPLVGTEHEPASEQPISEQPVSEEGAN